MAERFSQNSKSDWVISLSLFARRTGANAADVESLSALQNMRALTKRLHAGELLSQRGKDLKEVYFIKSGWACAYQELFDGRRQILNFLMPGDLCGPIISRSNQALSTVEALCTTEVVALPSPLFRTLATSNSWLADAIEWFMAHEQSIISEHLIGFGCRTACERLLHLILELLWRLERVDLTWANTFHLPVTHAQLGEATGLTPLHLQRTLHRLKESKLLEIAREHRVRILDRDAAQNACRFDAAYLE